MGKVCNSTKSTLKLNALNQRSWLLCTTYKDSRLVDNSNKKVNFENLNF